MHQWTTSELSYIEENAGKVPTHQLRKKYGCSLDALRGAKKRINADRFMKGLEPISLRFDKPLFVCPNCNQKTDRIIARSGWCKACTDELKLDSYHHRLEIVDREAQRVQELERNKAREDAVKRELDNLKQKKRTVVKTLVKHDLSARTEKDTVCETVTTTRDHPYSEGKRPE
ncbi:MAG: hypothetical protein HGA54_00930 [Actinobacteria bacterium]|nr:hypothetical protein [Actinomycetota bacterium]